LTPRVATAAFIANADFGRFSHFLHRVEPPDEVDFWQPSPHGFKAIPPGRPFFFRLGAPPRRFRRRSGSAFRRHVCPLSSPEDRS